MARVVVVGSGIAGLVAALDAAHDHEVVLVTKAVLAESNTRYAQGGIAAALFPDDSSAAHAADTLRAGAGLAVLEAVDALCADAPQRIRELIDLGVRFDRDGDGLARGLEAAHSRARVLHAGGDATGAEIERALVAAVRSSAARIVEQAFLLDVVMRDGAAAGVLVRRADGAVQEVAADAVVLATGGLGQLYAHTTNPAVATGDGVAAAWRAGAAIADLEFVQFHPTALAVPGSFLVSEAVRGEGAVLRNARGERFMLDVHPDAELAPRDVVARGIAVEMAAQGGAPVVLDATALGAAFLARRFPTIDAACRAAGMDWAREPVPVTPAAHYAMGGVATDTSGRTTVPGLFAVGEVACTGTHGANRLASNSLLEGLVFAHRAARAIGRPWEAAPEWIAEASVATAPSSSPHPDGTAEDQHAVPGMRFERARLQRLMWDAAGVHRDRAGLTKAAAELAATADPEPGEDRDLLQVGRLVVAAALAREESRGAHFRSDFPAPADPPARHTVLLPVAHVQKAALAC
ncbi:L-aspartate oxidase [Leifsonia sp. ZF2019]|uniref:L-aspartate oxidase n=1 Tax=Leifsonia sp. ZF2019 TaxID=2781978 RepID=UPI001CC12B99|nr:L-aspartate oxidase [Leifsonia sp. ZF2019]UAJ78209.1 L-aspartate oxidase [Leifsonia sp. ZF2019]